jgi:hypothetical protein
VSANAGDETLKARITGFANRAFEKVEQALEADDPEAADKWLMFAGAALGWHDENNQPEIPPQQINVTIDLKESQAA